MKAAEHGSEQVCEPIDSTGPFEHFDADPHRDEIRNDAHRDVESLLCPLDKLLVNGDAAQRGVEREKGQQARNRQRGNRIDEPGHNSLAGLLEGGLAMEQVWKSEHE